MSELKTVQERREKLLRGTRDAITLCSNAIVSLHRGKHEQASEQVGKAREILDELREAAQTDLYRYLIGAETELVEAVALQAIVSGNPISSLGNLNVNSRAYILGLLDCIGELKRLVYDRIRSGRSGEAADLFALMEQIYAVVFPFAAYDNIVPGVRRKLDVARFLIEDTRAVVTEESRRLLMLDAIDKLYGRLESDRK